MGCQRSWEETFVETHDLETTLLVCFHAERTNIQVVEKINSKQPSRERLCEAAVASRARMTFEQLDLVNRFKELSPRFYKKLSVISSFFSKVGSGQLQSFCYFDHSDTFYSLYCNYFIFVIIYIVIIFFFLCYSL